MAKHLHEPRLYSYAPKSEARAPIAEAAARARHARQDAAHTYAGKHHTPKHTWWVRKDVEMRVFQKAVEARRNRRAAR